VLLAVLLVHWIDAFGFAYFTVRGVGAALLFASQFTALPGFPELRVIASRSGSCSW
jgi:hypothetical protein